MSTASLAVLRWRPLRLAASVLASQGAWFACVLSAARGEPLLGLLAALAALAVMLWASGDRRTDALLIGVAIATGLVIDTLYVQFDLVRYASPWPLRDVAPAWILALWALWGALLREPLRWLHGRPIAAAVAGGLGGPLSYAAGARLGACTFAEPALAMAALAVCWAAVTPLQLALAARLERAALQRTPGTAGAA